MIWLGILLTDENIVIFLFLSRLIGREKRGRFDFKQDSESTSFTKIRFIQES